MVYCHESNIKTVQRDPLEVNVNANEITNLKVNYFIARFSEIGQFVLMYLKASWKCQVKESIGKGGFLLKISGIRASFCRHLSTGIPSITGSYTEISDL